MPGDLYHFIDETSGAYPADLARIAQALRRIEADTRAHGFHVPLSRTNRRADADIHTTQKNIEQQAFAIGEREG